MQRKTNLFYTQGNDSNFITFSNYTESLTANFLATDWKMYPDKFICMNIPAITNSTTKESFIKYLAARYENKLAFMRDKEIQTYPLEWLIESIVDYDASAKITFIGDVTEQHYTGVYSDTICTIDATVQAKEYTLQTYDNSSEDDTYIVYDKSQTYLYGWYVDNNGTEEYKGVADYSAVAPVFDSGTKYDSSIKYDEIKISTSTNTTIEFNVIIPLFVVMDIYYRQNSDIIDETVSMQPLDSNSNIINVPIGMWFANDTVTLNRDTTKYAPSWTLLLSSQFKPFPYTDPTNMPTELSSSDSTGEAFATFAQVLARQNVLLTKFENVITTLNSLSSRILAIESEISSMATEKNITDMSYQLSYVNDFANNIVTSMTSTINEHDIKWGTNFIDK